MKPPLINYTRSGSLHFIVRPRYVYFTFWLFGWRIHVDLRGRPLEVMDPKAPKLAWGEL